MVCAPVRRDNPRALATMLYLTCTTITSVDLAHYGVSRAKDWIYVDCGIKCHYTCGHLWSQTPMEYHSANLFAPS